MSEEARILLEKLKDARDVWTIVEGNMISLTQDEVHILMEEIDRLKNCNNSLIVIRDKYEVGIEEKDKEIEKLQTQLQQKESIIKEVREFAKLRKEMYERQENVVGQEVIINLLDILDKGE